MVKEKRLFTSESVTEGHPDKICDQISDAILDEFMRQDPNARVAVECAVKTGMVWVFGEVRSTAYVDIQSIVRETVREIGYTRGKYGFDADNLGIIVSIEEQSPDIAMGVDSSMDKEEELGAGDQGIMFGYATNETPELMPLPISLAHKLAYELSRLRKDGVLPYLRPDGKTQVTVEYDENDKPLRVDAVVVSTQHSHEISLEDLRKDIKEKLIESTIPQHLIDEDTKTFINPTGNFVIGGPKGDSGLTGRKVIVDTYGGMGRHGGGAFSSKDVTKVDRTAAYMARYIAKNVVAAGLADKCEIQLSYAIGVAEPTSLRVETFGTGKVNEDDLIKAIRKVFKLTPSGMIKQLDLRRPIFKLTAAYGHFGRELPEFTWEKTDKVEELLNELGR